MNCATGSCPASRSRSTTPVQAARRRPRRRARHETGRTWIVRGGRVPALRAAEVGPIREAVASLGRPCPRPIKVPCPTRSRPGARRVLRYGSSSRPPAMTAPPPRLGTWPPVTLSGPRLMSRACGSAHRRGTDLDRVGRRAGLVAGAAGPDHPPARARGRAELQRGAAVAGRSPGERRELVSLLVDCLLYTSDAATIYSV